MKKKKRESIFKRYYAREKFIDRYLREPNQGVDVIIPLMHANELWKKNLISFYREIPIKRLLIGDGGCIDNSLKIAKKFPRVKIFNHRSYRSLGFSIRKLIEAVETDWFVYLHTDVYLPKNWFRDMNRYRKKYDWFECRQYITILADYPLDYTGLDRPFSGTQMGRRAAFREVLPIIEDDYLYRNEDIIYAELLRQKGGRYGRVEDVIHYHQVMNKASRWKREIKDIVIKKGEDEARRDCLMQAKGMIKYTNPTQKYYLNNVTSSIAQMEELGILDRKKFERWVKKTNPKWLKHITSVKVRKKSFQDRLRKFLGGIYQLLKNF